jgi:hypothetical protein
MKTKPIKLNWEDYGQFMAARMATLGFSTRHIAESTDMTVCQVQYRLGKTGIKRKEYRDGESPLAELVWRRMREQQEVSQVVWAHIKATEEKNERKQRADKARR